MPTDLTTALGSRRAPIIHSCSSCGAMPTRPVPPRTQPELTIAREFSVPTTRTFTLTGNATRQYRRAGGDPRNGIGGTRAAHGGVTMSASASLPGCLACTPAGAIDGDTATAWQTPFITVLGQWAQYTNATPLTFDHLDLQ